MALGCGISNEELSATIRKCCCVLKSYSWLVDAYILDFFTEDLWRRLPQGWQEVMLDAEIAELGSWLDFSQTPRFRRPWPLSLLSLRAALLGLCLPRRTLPCSSGQPHTEGCGHPEVGPSSVGRLRRVFQKHVSPKKIHEIFKMAEVVCQMALDTNVSHIVDVGSGVGHLSRLLSYGHALSVCCVEAQETLSSKARKLDDETEHSLGKILTEDEVKKLTRPVHVTYNVGLGFEETDFMQLVSQAFRSANCPDNPWLSRTEFGIVGLHPCGDLAPYLMQMFVQCSDARFLCIAGCCYMKLTPGIGFPMSTKVMTQTDAGSPWQEGFQLSYESREMACHAIEAYSQNLLLGNISSLKIHCYRATLETIIMKNWPKLRRKGLKNFKYDENLPFSEYAKRALLAANLIPPEKDIASKETEDCLARWRQVVCFYSLRLMLAPLVETLILVDRFLFFSLQGISCRINPEFDPEVSPRNHLLIASKSSSMLKHFS